MPGDITLDLLIGGQLVESRTLTVSELSLEQVIFTTTAPSVAGTYSVVVQAEGVESVQDEFIVISVPDAEGFILIESIQVSSTTVAPGDSVTVTLVLRNPTSFAAEDTFSVNLDGAPFDSVVVALGPGESATRTFDITESALGTHEVDIDGDILTLTTFEVEAPATPADLSLVGPTTTPDDVPLLVVPDQPVNVFVTLRNDGDEDGDTQIIVRVNGVEEETRPVTVPGNGVKIEPFDIFRTQEGDYTVEVEAVGDKLTVEFTV